MRFAISFFALAASVAAQLDVSASAIAATRLATSHQWVTSADGVKIFAEAIGSPNNPHGTMLVNDCNQILTKIPK
jgi:hypothetical protein